jgi:cyclophilin family peptidyl-prolyl cis-trans isomerase
LGLLQTQAQTQTPDPSDTTYVRFSIYEGNTFFGNIDVQMLSKEAPLNVANFMGYANGLTVNGVTYSYNNSFIHRSIPGFIIQGGEYNFVNGSPTAIYPNAPNVAGEHEAGNPLAFSNERGTLAMALSAATDTTPQYDTATTSWFFNLVDNNNDTADNNLDQSAGGGPFTVFGVIANSSSLAVMDAIAAVPTFDFGGDFANLPLLDYTTTDYNNNATVYLSDFIYVNSITAFTPTTFTTWQAAFASDPNATTDEAPAATPQNDGTTNLLKYFCGITANATMSAEQRAKLPTVSSTTTSGTSYMVLTWHQRPNLVGVYATVQTSTDLATWTTASETPTQTGTDSDGDSIMQVQVPAPATGAQFIRLSLSQSSS